MLQLQIGDTAPNFQALTTQGLINFYGWMGSSWTMFFSHPGDFTPVCTTELGRVSQLEDELAKRNVKPLGLSLNSIESHLAWIDDINDSQDTDFFVPMIADENGLIASLYGMLHSKEDGYSPVRQLYIIDSTKTVRFSIAYPGSVGRNFCEILRVIDALHLTDSEPLNTPVEWQPGEPAIISAALNNELAAQLYPQGWDEVLPYIRLVEPA